MRKYVVVLALAVAAMALGPTAALRKSEAMRRELRALGAAGALLLLVALYVAAGAAAFEPTSTAAEGPALADAQARLEGFVPPPGAQRVASPPEGTGASGPQINSGPNWLHTTGYWADSEPVGAVEEYLNAYAPPESSLLIKSSASIYGTFVGGSVAYVWPELPGIATGRSLEVSFAPTAAGGTSITADAQVVWVEPRLSSSDVPAAARYLEVTETHDGKVRKATTSNARRIASVVALANRMPIAQPSGPSKCPAFPRDPATLRTVFRRAPGGTILASLVQEVPMNACNSIKLTVRGVPQRALVDGNELARSLRALLAQH